VPDRLQMEKRKICY